MLSPGSAHCAPPWKYRTVFQIWAICELRARVLTMLSLCSSALSVTRDRNSSLWNIHPCIFFFPENIALFFGSKATLLYSFWCQLEQIFIPKHLTTVLYCQNILLRSWNRSVRRGLKQRHPRQLEQGSLLTIAHLHGSHTQLSSCWSGETGALVGNSPCLWRGFHQKCSFVSMDFEGSLDN